MTPAAASEPRGEDRRGHQADVPTAAQRSEGPVRGYVATSAGQLHYRAAGVGQPLVLLHQSPRSSAMFSEVIQRLQDAYRCVAIDLPGFGNSDPLPRGAMVENMANLVMEAIGRLGLERPHLFGIHFGNKVAIEIAAAHGHRLSDVILCGQPHSLLETREQHANAVFGLNGHAPGHPGAGNLGSDPLRWRLFTERVHQLFQHVASEYHSGPPMPAAGHYLRCLVDMAESWPDVDRAYEAIFEFELAKQFAKISVPTAVIEMVTPWEEREFGSQEPWLRSRHADLVYRRLDYSDDNSPPIAVGGWSNWDAGDLVAAIREVIEVLGNS